MIGLLAPLGLAALAALVLPLLIHLLRKPEDRVVLFAAWRYLAEPARPRERLQLRHWLLLALRLLLIAVLALLLSQTIWRSNDQVASAVTLLWPGAESAAALSTQDHPVQQLSANAPSSELRQIDTDLPPGATLSVIVPEIASGLDAERLRLSRDVQWKIVPGSRPVIAEAGALKVSIRSDGSNAAEAATAQALLQAWQSQGRVIEIDSAAQGVPMKPDTGLLFWLGGKPGTDVDRWIARGGRALISQQADVTTGDAAWRVRAQGRGRSLVLSTAFDASKVAALREPAIPAQLAALLLPEPTIDRALAASVAPLNGAASGRPPGSPLDSMLVLIAALLFAAERLWAARLQRR
jgi:hypothetical protein